MRTSNTFSYIAGLDQFYAHSNEDEADADCILEWLIAHSVFRGSERDTIRWLDVGAGPLGKIVRVLARWKKELNPKLPQLTLLEPLSEWDSARASNLAKYGLHNLDLQLFRTTWEDFAETVEVQDTFDIVTFLHSLYGVRLDPCGCLHGMGILPRMLTEKGWTCFAIESPDSDLLWMKRRLFPELGLTLVDYSVVESTIRHFGWRFFVQGDVPQRLYLGEARGSREEALEDADGLRFIFQTEPQLVLNLGEAETTALRSAAAKRLKHSESGWYLDVPDRLYWMRPTR